MRPGWAAAGLSAAMMLFAPRAAMSQAITVGQARDGSCLFSTIGGALTEAKARWDRDGVRQEIRISRDVVGQVWNGVSGRIADMDVTLVGGFADCQSDDIDGTTVVSGAGGARAPVFSITGRADVRFEHLHITQGDALDDEAGGIDFHARGDLRLENMLLSDNRGGAGGAIHFESVGGEARLELVSHVTLTNNKGQSGGGIHIAAPGDNKATLRTGPDVVIHHNDAINGGGGGIAARGKVFLELFGPGSQLHHNTATGHGGGLDYWGSRDVDMGDFLVEQNTADKGGGLHLQGRDSAMVINLGDNVTLLRNIARSHGGAIHLEGEGVGVALFGMMGRNTSVA